MKKKKPVNNTPSPNSEPRNPIKLLPPFIIIIFLLFFLVRGLIFASITPPWQAPDEPLHYDYMHYLALDKKLPVLGEITICREIQNSLRGYRFSQIIAENMPYRSGKKISVPLNYTGPTAHEKKIKKAELIFVKKSKSPNQIIQHPPLYYAGGAFLYLLFLRLFSLTAQIWILRFISVLLGLATVYIGYLSAKQLFEKNRYLQYAVVGFLALQPMFGYIFSVINNDSLTIFLFSVLVYQMILVIKKGLKTPLLYGMAVVFALGMLTKVSFAVALPAIAFAVFFAKKKEVPYYHYLGAFALSSLLFGWWYVRLILVYGTLLPRIDFYPLKPNNPWANVSLPGFLIFTNFKNKIFSSFWGSFGWLRLKYPYRINFILKMFSYIVLTGLGLDIVLRFFRKVKWNDENKLIVLSLILVVVLLVSIILPSWSGIKKTGIIEGVQGRYLFPLMIPLAFLLAISVNRLVSYKNGYYTFVVITLFVLALDFLAIFRYFLPYFYG